MPKSDIRKVKPPRLVGRGDELPLKGHELIDQNYCNVFLAAVTRSGKTVTLNHLIKHTIDKRTRVVIFAHTVHIDPTYIDLIKWLERKGIEHVVYTSLTDGKIDNIQTELDIIESNMNTNPKIDNIYTAHRTTIYNQFPSIYTVHTNASRSTPKIMDESPVVYKDSVPENISILDDLSKTALRNTRIINLLKESRHYRLRVFISSQGLLHITPDAMQNLWSVYLYKGFSKKQIYQLAERISTSLSPDELWSVYKSITKQKYQFMNMNLTEDTIRPIFYKPLKLTK